MSELFSKIPTNIWDADGAKFRAMGGRDGFLIYSLITSRKGLDNKVYLTMNQIMEVLALCKNRDRHKARIIKGLDELALEGYISVDDSRQKINDTMVIDWEDKFAQCNQGWRKFFANDFELYAVMGEIPYLTMWMLRMFENHRTGTSFLSLTTMADLLECRRNSVQNATNLFRETGLFEVKTGEYYYNRKYGKKIRRNNEYRYTGNKEGILTMTSERIETILNSS